MATSVYYVKIEEVASAFRDLAEGCVESPSYAAGTTNDLIFNGVGNGNNPGTQKNLRTSQTRWISAAIQSFMMLKDHLCYRRFEGNPSQNLEADLAMSL